jgi:hypothetical protein
MLMRWSGATSDWEIAVDCSTSTIETLVNTGTSSVYKGVATTLRDSGDTECAVANEAGTLYEAEVIAEEGQCAESNPAASGSYYNPGGTSSRLTSCVRDWLNYNVYSGANCSGEAVALSTENQARGGQFASCPGGNKYGFEKGTECIGGLGDTAVATQRLTGNQGTILYNTDACTSGTEVGLDWLKIGACTNKTDLATTGIMARLNSVQEYSKVAVAKFEVFTSPSACGSAGTGAIFYQSSVIGEPFQGGKRHFVSTEDPKDYTVSDCSTNCSADAPQFTKETLPPSTWFIDYADANGGDTAVTCLSTEAVSMSGNVLDRCDNGLHSKTGSWKYTANGGGTAPAKKLYSDTACTTLIGEQDPTMGSMKGLCEMGTRGNHGKQKLVYWLTDGQIAYDDSNIVVSAINGTSEAICFAGTETLLLDSGQQRQLQDINIGDRVQVFLPVEGGHQLGFDTVVALPHPRDNRELASFLHVETVSGRGLKLSHRHLVAGGVCPNEEAVEVDDKPQSHCSSADTLQSASALAPGDCLCTVSGPERIVSVASSEQRGVYSVVTASAQSLLAVNGVKASPFALNHFWPNAYYSLFHRMIYNLFPGQYTTALADQFTSVVGGIVSSLEL